MRANVDAPFEVMEGMMSGLIALGLLVGVCWFIKAYYEHVKLVGAQKRSFLASRSDWDLYASAYNQRIVGIGPHGQEVVLGTTVRPITYPIDRVVTVEVLKDGATVTSHARGVQLAGAMLGGAAFGGIGAIIGGLSGSTTSRTNINTLALKIIVDDRTSPVHVVEFFRSPSKRGVSPTSILVRRAADTADRYHAMLLTALRNSKPDNASEPKPSNQSETDQLAGLWKLREAGALTAEEFEAAKGRLIGSPLGVQAPRTVGIE